MQTGPTDAATPTADAQKGNWVDRFAPPPLRPYLRLARWDRPIGFWLLFWPCALSTVLAAVARPAAGVGYGAILLYFVGAVAMRGAGCTFNDIVDRDIDDKVARTRSRPLPSGQVTLQQAAAFLILQLLVGLAVLLQFNQYAIWLGIGSLVLVVIYPFMKRVTWWPQLFLGLAFSWGALMGWAGEIGALHAPAYWLYLGAILWTIGYDTIYALQDIEDDALIGVKSTARLFGRHARVMVTLFYIAAAVAWVMAGLTAGADPMVLIPASLPAFGILLWQVLTLDPKSAQSSLRRFKANHYVGLAFWAALYLAYRF